MTQTERRLQPGQAEAFIIETHSSRFCHNLNAAGGQRAFSRPPLNEEPFAAGHSIVGEKAARIAISETATD